MPAQGRGIRAVSTLGPAAGGNMAADGTLWNAGHALLGARRRPCLGTCRRAPCGMPAMPTSIPCRATWDTQMPPGGPGPQIPPGLGRSTALRGARPGRPASIGVTCCGAREIPFAIRPRVGLLRRRPPRPAPPRATSLDARLSLVWACRPCRLPAYKAVDDNPLTQRPHGRRAHKCQKHVEAAGTQAPDQHLGPNKSEPSTPWLWNIESIDAAIITATMRQVVHGLPLISRRSSTSPCRPGQHDSRRRKRSGCKDMAERRGQRHQECGRHQGKDGDAEAQVQHRKPWSW